MRSTTPAFWRAVRSGQFRTPEEYARGTMLMLRTRDRDLYAEAVDYVRRVDSLDAMVDDVRAMLGLAAETIKEAGELKEEAKNLVAEVLAKTSRVIGAVADASEDLGR